MQGDVLTQIKESGNNMKNYLMRNKSLHCVTSIFTNEEDTNKFSMGFVVDVTDTHLLLGMVTPYGRYDGFAVKELETVYRIEYGGNYHTKLSKLYGEYKQTHDNISTSEGPIMDLIDYAKQNGLIVSIELFESGSDDIRGFVKSVDNNFLTVHKIDEYGNEDGESIFDINDITHILCDTENEAMMKKLFEI